MNPTFTLAPEVIDVLRRSTVTADRVILPALLDRPTYEAVNRALTAYGGKWNRSAKAHLFTSDPRLLLGDAVLTGKATDQKKLYQFYPTPETIARRMVDLADIKPGTTVLEPSAGEGSIALAARAAGATVTCLEICPDRVAKLRSHGFPTFERDFLEARNLGAFDCVLMNPPFTGDQDIQHVNHAWKFVKPGGRLIAITSPGFTFGKTSRRAAFREFVEAHGEIQTLPSGTFADTDVTTALIALHKPLATAAPKPMKESRQTLRSDNLDEVIRSATNATQKGTQQFLTPDELAAACMLPLSDARRYSFLDWNSGAGSLLAASEARHPIGCDIDPQAARAAHVATADITALFPLLSEADFQFDTAGFNPPFPLRWHTDRLASLAESRLSEVREAWEVYGQGDAIDSTVATVLMAMDRCAVRGEFFVICNHASAIRHFGKPDASIYDDTPVPAIRSRLWLWVELKGCTLFGTAAPLDVAVLYFAPGHHSYGDKPHHVQIPGDDIDAIHAGMAEIRITRAIKRRGLSLHREDDCNPDVPKVWRTVLEEYGRRQGERKPVFNIWMENSRLCTYLTPFQQRSLLIKREEVERLFALDGQHPQSLVVQQHTRMALLTAIRGDLWQVDPSVGPLVDAAIREYNAVRAPFYPLNEVQRLGYLDEHDRITCKEDLRHPTTGEFIFFAGQDYPLATSSAQLKRPGERVNILGETEIVELTGTELRIEITDANGARQAFMPDGGDKTHPALDLNLLLQHFTIPHVEDIAVLRPDAYAQAIAALKSLEATINA